MDIAEEWKLELLASLDALVTQIQTENATERKAKYMLWCGRDSCFSARRAPRLGEMPDNATPEIWSLIDAIQQQNLFDSFTDKELGLTLLADFDYEAQLAAVRSLLLLHKSSNQALGETIAELSVLSGKTSGMVNERVIDEWLEHMQRSVYQDAAHSMAAVGMLAPLFESLWSQSFNSIRSTIEIDLLTLGSHPRWRGPVETVWDCHYVVNEMGKPRKDLVNGAWQLAEALGLSTYLPLDVRPTSQALFAYRNKMFHLGFEWPPSERELFQRQMAAWPTDWFASATSDHKPWIFYLTDTFVLHCLGSIDKVLSGLGAFARALPWHKVP